MKSQLGKNEGGLEREEAYVEVEVHSNLETPSDRNEDGATASRPRRQRSAPVKFVARPSKNGRNCDEGGAEILDEAREERPTTRGTSSTSGERDIESTKPSIDWSDKEDAELTKLVNKHGTSWRDCLDDSRTFREKYEHISDESARDRLRRRWRTLCKNADTVDWSQQDYTEDDVRNEICRQVDIHGTDWKEILAMSSREFETFDSSSSMRPEFLYHSC